MSQFTASVEIRTWFKGGKYQGKDVTWEKLGPDTLTPEAFKAAAPVISSVARQHIQSREEAMAFRTPESHDWEYYSNANLACYPVRLDDWGEFRVITYPKQSAKPDEA